MVQRIQSIFLLIALVIFFFMIDNPLAQIFTEDGSIIELNYLKLHSTQSSSFKSIIVWPLTFLIFSVMAIEFVTIFLYKKRTMQMRFCMFNILLMFGLVGMVYYYAKFSQIGLLREEVFFQWPIVVPFISMILTYLALKAIQKDDAMVKSWERLR